MKASCSTAPGSTWEEVPDPSVEEPHDAVRAA